MARNFGFKYDLDVSKIRQVTTDSVVYEEDSVVECYTISSDISLHMHAATGSRRTYMLKNSGDNTLFVYFDGVDTLDYDITCMELFPYESILITDSKPGCWLMLDFHILWLFQK